MDAPSLKALHQRTWLPSSHRFTVRDPSGLEAPRIIAALESQRENPNCAVPLRVGLLSLQQARPCVEANECASRCNGNDGSSCVNLGVLYADGNGVTQDDG